MAVVINKGIFIVAAKRTPFGRFGGAFKDVYPADLLAAAAKDALKAGSVAPAVIDTVNIGQVYGISGSSDGGLSPRHAALKAGIPEDKPALGISRLCGSGFQAVVNSAQDIITGVAQTSLAGGTENMSTVPFVVRNTRFGTGLGVKIPFEDVLTGSSLDTSCNATMPETAENLAEKYGLQRMEVDQYALQSQQRWKAAQYQGAFKAEMTPVTVKVKRQEKVVEVDEHPRPETTTEMLSRLPVLFRKGGVVTAGNSSGVNDGAGALVLASEESVKQNGFKPLVRLLAWSVVGVDPSIMGIGPVPAIQNLLTATGLKLDDIDLVEINEAFSAQTLACAKELGLDQSKLNVNGGAIAMGHPVGASGARITAHLAHELRRRGLKRGIGSACIGGGQGIALLLETLSQCDGGKTPRYCGIYSGVPISSPALGISKACGTGLQAIINSAVDIITGNSKITLAGGTDLMSSLPMLVRNVRFGTALGASYRLEDHIQKQIPDSYTGLTMQKMVEDLAKTYGVTREEADEFALQSHLKWKAAEESKAFEQELVSITATIKKKQIVVVNDELPQPSIKTEDLSKLPVLIENGEVLTSGNTSVPADGAAALLVAHEEAVRSHDLRPLARVVGWTCVGVDPKDAGIGGVHAVKKLLEEQKLRVDDVDLFEINENFASQALIAAKELKIDLSKINVSGGALAIGDPISATGARMATHLVHEISRRNLKRGIAASSCGGGQGIAILLEKI